MAERDGNIWRAIAAPAAFSVSRCYRVDRIEGLDEKWTSARVIDRGRDLADAPIAEGMDVRLCTSWPGTLQLDRDSSVSWNRDPRGGARDFAARR